MSEALIGRRILVVEDEMLIMMQAMNLLKDLVCIPVAAATIASALERLAEASFDAAMLDVNLGGMMSYPIADALIALSVPFVFATGYVDGDSRTGYMTHAVLRKPFRAQQLSEALEGLIAGKPA